MNLSAARAIDGQRTVVLASADATLRQRLRASLAEMRWRVIEAEGGASAFAQIEDVRPDALLMDTWLPDLEVGEFASQVQRAFPGIDLLRVDGATMGAGARCPRRHELLHALREAQDRPASGDGAAWNTAPVAVPMVKAAGRNWTETTDPRVLRPTMVDRLATPEPRTTAWAIEGLVGRTPVMAEVAQLIRLVAPRRATVLIEGETGTGKEVVANAVHRLSTRVAKPFVVLNCAAIPEALLEAELFGHVRGAFTGAVQSRVGRIEAANGGTLFLDEIGEMPMALQAKMLRFLECGELQRVGDNEAVCVDVRVIAATHQHLEERSAKGTFRLDLYHRLAVFPIDVPPLRERMEDLPLLSEHILEGLGKEFPRKRLSAGAREKLWQHDWPGNVRELGHVLERGAILCGDAAEIGAEHIRFRRGNR